jgi:hypothetical protein
MAKSSSSPAVTTTLPGLRRVISGAWRGAMPSSPSSPVATTRVASPWKICSALTMSQRIVLMACPVSREMRALQAFSSSFLAFSTASSMPPTM